LKENELYEFQKLEIQTKSHRLENKKGRPGKGEDVQTFYLIEAEIKHDQENKEQGTVEREFRFLKDKSFRVS